MSKKVYITVTNDLSSDQRVHKVCTSLKAEGFDIHLVGRKLKDSAPINREYATHRMSLLFTSGALFYAFFNIRLFLFLMFRKMDIIHSNDLDTLLACYLVSKLKGIPIVYDSHEYFTGVPEIQHRPFVKKVWTTIEKRIFPKLKYIFTVNDSIAELYYQDYGKRLHVMRNIPFQQALPSPIQRDSITDDPNKKILVLQGAGINVDRGSEELLEAMAQLDNYILMIIGTGDVINVLKARSAQDDLKGKVQFMGRLPYEEMMRFTQIADAGLTLDKDTNINYKFSLPNKVFDYIRAGIPVISSNIIEIKKILEHYQVGTTLPNHDPVAMAKGIDDYLRNLNKEAVKQNLAKAGSELSWENEFYAMKEVYQQLKN